MPSHAAFKLKHNLKAAITPEKTLNGFVHRVIDATYAVSTTKDKLKPTHKHFEHVAHQKIEANQ